jgi:transcriptional regulator with XRE-family HTH domain
VESNLEKGIAFQIRATRDRQGMTQAELAETAGMGQNNVSRLESPEYGKHTMSSLKRIADALDVALVVRFVPWSQYIDWLSGTPRFDRGLTADALAVPSFEDEEGAGLIEEGQLQNLIPQILLGVSIDVQLSVGTVRNNTYFTGMPITYGQPQPLQILANLSGSSESVSASLTPFQSYIPIAMNPTTYEEIHARQ